MVPFLSFPVGVPFIGLCFFDVLERGEKALTHPVSFTYIWGTCWADSGGGGAATGEADDISGGEADDVSCPKVGGILTFSEFLLRFYKTGTTPSFVHACIRFLFPPAPSLSL